MPSAPSQEELALARRTWRLAILTTGDAALARRSLETLPTPAPGEPLDADRIDRLAIQAIRRAAGPSKRLPIATDAPPAPPRVPVEPMLLGPAHEALAALPLQAAEAWVLRKLDDLDPIRACRAMDCSRSAADRFLERAETEIAQRLGTAHADPIGDLQRAAETLSADQHVLSACIHRARQRARRTIARILVASAAVLAGLLAAASLLW